MNDRWLSVDEIGEYLGVKRDTVYKWINDKGMPAHKIGRLWKFKKEDVDSWVKQGEANTSNNESLSPS
ncbi:methylation-associated defense system helix-turn-helix domain-containing protein MAD1 [Legionella pneumophila]|uniref:methylation-associated defense system helix-turn-helix domain-containing protein MAD1 n=1 Tax=Legionella pneumophila TaxID=446 RepID=UPI000875E46D|nr:helix-turn-helix domain-containing protein [Legionella pneumophila]AOW51186.1 transcriptional regulator [Legionella pneumophila subsp. pneumophila]AOW55211.1 transcriptional regulator [Legionella pneumophila subsp. pneumophila]AOW64694.1 transcriptional regulator [Legionella pneumophila subsp. pneumophila]MCZ4746917.1 helix-turn-helix domain-containing protein [Legionella pneumophila]HAT1881195.1 helix-turn-helix domain-containing protein [Legionella pneumophila]